TLPEPRAVHPIAVVHQHQRPDDGAGVLGTHVQLLAEGRQGDLQVLDERIGLVLGVERVLVRVLDRVLGAVVDLAERGREVRPGPAFGLATRWALRGLRSVLRPCVARPALWRRALPWPRPFGVDFAAAFDAAFDGSPSFSSAPGSPCPFADAAAGGSAIIVGTSPSTPSGVTMIECGRPSGPLPFLPRTSSVFSPPVRFVAIFWSCSFSFATASRPPLSRLHDSTTSSM